MIDVFIFYPTFFAKCEKSTYNDVYKIDINNSELKYTLVVIMAKCVYCNQIITATRSQAYTAHVEVCGKLNKALHMISVLKAENQRLIAEKEKMGQEIMKLAQKPPETRYVQNVYNVKGDMVNGDQLKLLRDYSKDQPWVKEMVEDVKRLNLDKIDSEKKLVEYMHSIRHLRGSYIEHCIFGLNEEERNSALSVLTDMMTIAGNRFRTEKPDNKSAIVAISNYRNECIKRMSTKPIVEEI